MPTPMLIEVESYNGEDMITLAGRGEGGQGVVLTDQGMQGAWSEQFSSIWNSHAFQVGADFGGVRINKSDIVIPVHIKGTPGSSVSENMSRWRKMWSKQRDSKLFIEDEDSRRSMPLRISETIGFNPTIDPNFANWAHMVMTCVAKYPRWSEPDDVPEPWVNPTDTTGVTFNPNNPLQGASLGVIPITNPTDCDLWVQYKLQAYPGARYILPDYSFGDNRYRMGEAHRDRKIVMPPLIAGEHLYIDTDETKDQVKSSLNTPMYIRMKGVRFLYPIPAYTLKPVNLTIGVVGAPAGVGVQVTLRREWSAPVGLQ